MANFEYKYLNYLRMRNSRFEKYYSLSQHSYVDQASLSSNFTYHSFQYSQRDPHQVNELFLKSRLSERQNYLNLLYRSMIYVRKQKLRTIIDDGILVEELSAHINVNKITPSPFDGVGDELLRDGYILVAYSILMGRLHKSWNCYLYLMAYFQSTHSMITHQKQFLYYFDQIRASLTLRKEMSKEKSGNDKNEQGKLKRNKITGEN